MRVLLVHPSPLMYSEIYLRLEPLVHPYTNLATLRETH